MKGDNFYDFNAKLNDIVKCHFNYVREILSKEFYKELN